MLRLATILVIFVTIPNFSSDVNWPNSGQKPWIDPIPAPENPSDPTEPDLGNPHPGFPEPMPFRPGLDRLLNLVEELRREIAHLKSRLSRLESFHNRNESPIRKQQKACQSILPLIKKASAEFLINGGTMLDFDGQIAPFSTLQTAGYLANIPNDWRSIRGKLPGNISCIP